jgi:transcriptional regulator with XRE-family HTH domain
MTRPKKSPEEHRNASEIGGRLQKLRESAGLSQEEVAARIGGSRRAISDYEKGRTPLPTALARSLCDAFDLNFDWLMTGEGPQRKTELFQNIRVRHAELEAHELVQSVRKVVERHDSTKQRPGSIDDRVASAVRISFGLFEREFTARKGPAQFARFIDLLLATIKELLGHDLLRCTPEQLLRALDLVSQMERRGYLPRSYRDELNDAALDVAQIRTTLDQQQHVHPHKEEAEDVVPVAVAAQSGRQTKSKARRRKSSS